jgi:hypothetical protein
VSVPQQLLEQMILQFPIVAILVWLLFRLDRRMADLILVICEMATDRMDQQFSERIDRYLKE